MQTLRRKVLMGVTVVYCMRASDDENLPMIDHRLPENSYQRINWPKVGRILRHEAADCEYETPHLRVKGRGVKNCHFYHVAGTFGVYSKEVIDLIGCYMDQYFDFIDVTVNDLPFYFIRQIGTLDCLDRSQSEWIPFPDDPEAIMRITTYRFFKDKIDDPIVFTVPDTPTEVFATQTIKDTIEQSGLRGLIFLDAEKITN